MGDDAPKDVDPPELIVTQPERAADRGLATTVRVAGWALDHESGIESVRVNDVQVILDENGQFEAYAELLPGTTLVHTVAVDRAGNESVDTRAVFTGEMVPQQTTVPDALVTRITEEGFAGLSALATETLSTLDLGALLAESNPVIDKGVPCLNVQISVLDLTHGPLSVELRPIPGGLAYDVKVDDALVDLWADFSAVCIPGSAPVTMTADSLHTTGTVDVYLDGNDELIVDVNDDAQTTVENFGLEVGALPTDVIELFQDEVDDVVAALVTSQIKKQIPGLVEDYLATGFTGSIPVFGRNLDVLIRASDVAFNSAGARIALDSNFEISGWNDDAEYLHTPRPVPSLLDAPVGVQVAVADDMMNQLINAFWSAGAMEISFELEGDGSSDGGLAARVDRIDVSMPLRPTATMELDGTPARVVLGDLLVDIVDTDGGEDKILTRVAVSAVIDLDVQSDASNAMRLVTAGSQGWVNVLDKGVEQPNPLDDPYVETLGSAVVEKMTAQIGELVGEIYLPVFQSVTLDNISLIQGGDQGGYVILGGDVQVH